MKGMPSKYREEYDDQAHKLTLLGAIDTELAAFFEVAEPTIHTWKKKHPSFAEAVRTGKDMANANVSASLYQRAVGYSHPESKVFMQDGKEVVVEITKHYPPDATAISLWLRNRSAVKGAIGIGWKDKQELEVTNPLEDFTDEKLDERIKQLQNGQAGQNSVH